MYHFSGVARNSQLRGLWWGSGAETPASGSH